MRSLLGLSIGMMLGSFCGYSQHRIVEIDKRKSVVPNEPSVYIHPLNDRIVFAGSNIDNYYRSSNGGKTWKKQKMESSLGVWGDPVLFADSSGTVYFSHLSRTPGKSNYEYIDRIVVQRSTNEGKSFEDGVGVGYNGLKAQDKQWMSADNHSEIFRGRAYISWTEFDKYESKKPEDHSRIRFSYSIDQGKSFSPAMTVSDTVGDCLDDDNTLEGATTTVCLSGKVLMAWSGYENIYLDASENGGKDWGTDRVIARQPGGWVIDISHIYRCNGLPFLVTDFSQGKFRGRVYLLWGSTKHGNADIWLKYSDDEGETWSEDKRVNNTSTTDTSSQFLGHLAVDPLSGYLYTVFYDRRHSEHNTFMDVYVAVSKDGGETFENYRITPRSFATPGKAMFFGDYNGIDARNGEIRPIWTQTLQKKGLSIRTALLREQIQDATLQQHLSAYFLRDQELLFHFYFNKPVSSGTIKVSRRGRVISRMGFANASGSEKKEQEIVFEIPELRKGLKYRITLKTDAGRLKTTVKNPVTPYPLAYFKQSIKQERKEKKRQKQLENKW